MAKNASKNKNKTLKKESPKAAPVMSRVKTLVQGLAKGMGAKAMAGKAAKKAQTKAAPKAAKSQGKVAKAASAGKAAKPLKVKAQKPEKNLKAAKTEKVEKPGKQAKPAKPETTPKAESKGVIATPKAGKGKGAKPMVLAHHEKMCRESGCENLATTKGYCRLDYIKNWKKIKRKEMILKEGKLNQYIEELVSKYPDKYIEVIRQDLSTEVNFNKVIHDLELDETIDDLDYDGDSIDSLIGSIRKEDDDFGDSEF